MADVEVDLLLDLQEARRRLGEFRRELDGVERQAEEIQERGGGGRGRPPGAADPETGRRGGARQARRERSKLKRQLDDLKDEVNSTFEIVEKTAEITANLMFQIGAQIKKIPGLNPLGEHLQTQAGVITGIFALREKIARALEVGEDLTDLAQGGVTPTKALFDEMLARAVNQAGRDAELAKQRDRLRASRGGDAVWRLVVESIKTG